MHCTCKTLLGSAFTATAARPTTAPPIFLIPAFTHQTSQFSTSIPQRARKDGNRNRGVSALRRTGLNRVQVNHGSIDLAALPKPVNKDRRIELWKDQQWVESESTHGLWDFFPANRASMGTPEQISHHGREWSVLELRTKNWSDLHRLWWTCIKELNRLETGRLERARVKQVHGDYESNERVRTVKATMRNIKFTLTERWYAFEDARELAMDDPMVDLYAEPGEAGAGLKEEDDENRGGPAKGDLTLSEEVVMPAATASSGVRLKATA